MRPPPVLLAEGEEKESARGGEPWMPGSPPGAP